MAKPNQTPFWLPSLKLTARAANILKNWWLEDSFMFFSVSFREGKQTNLQKDMFISSHILVSESKLKSNPKNI